MWRRENRAGVKEKKDKMYKPTLVKIEGKRKLTEEDYLFKIKTKIDYYPGQFLQAGVLGIGEAPISICSYSGDYVELSVKIIGNVTKALCSLEKGDVVGIRGPYGRGYPIQLFKGDSIIMVGGGCGIAPMRSALQYIEKNREDYQEVYIFFGFRNPEEILFREDIEKWQEKFNCNISVDEGNKNWKGKVGFVTEILEKEELNNDRKVVFVCGPPVMINHVVEILKKKGFNDEQIFVSYERHMKCGTGKCGHCMVGGRYACKDGPVFRYDEVKELNE